MSSTPPRPPRLEMWNWRAAFQLSWCMAASPQKAITRALPVAKANLPPVLSAGGRLSGRSVTS